MPATRSRISASSSTIRISALMRSLVHALFEFGLANRRLAGRREADAHQRAALARIFLGGVAQLDLPAMLLDDAADDRQAEPGALFARGDVGLQQPAALFLRQADAVVDHVDDDVDALARGKDADRPFAELCRRYRGDRFGRVLDDVGQGLRDQPA